MALPRALGRLNQRITNKAATRIVRRVPGYAVVVHKGRKSGIEYRTPVSSFADSAGFRIPLTCGPHTDWVKNVMAADEFEIEHRNRTIALTNPEILCDAGAGWAPIDPNSPGSRQTWHSAPTLGLHRPKPVA